MNFQKVLNLKKSILNYINDNKDIVLSRNRKINIKHVLYLLAHKEGNSLSFDQTISHLNCKSNINITKTALINKIKNIQPSFIENLNKHILDEMCKTSTKSRIIAVDGSKISLLKIISKDGAKLMGNKSYSSILISSLYDIEKKVPINYKVSTEMNERKLLISQLDYVNKGDILVMDRGYYSEDLVNIFLKKGIKFVFRIRSNLKVAKSITSKEKDVIKTIKLKSKKQFKCRVLKYKIYKDLYFLFTNLINKNKFSTEKLKKVYKDRWLIETDFGYSKKYLTIGNLRYKSLNMVKKSLAIINFIQIADSIINQSICFQKKHKKIDKGNSLFILINHIFFPLLFKKNGAKVKSKIKKYILIISNCTTKIMPNRKYSRVTKLPPSKWFQQFYRIRNRYKR